MIEVREAPPEHYGWIAERAQLVIAGNFKAIAAYDGDRIVGMVGYDGWTPNSCAMHVAIDKPIAVRRLIREAFEIPFVRLGRGVVIGSVLETNQKALKLDLHLGFQPLCFIRDGWAKGVGIHVLQMRREDCRFLR